MRVKKHNNKLLLLLLAGLLAAGCLGGLYWSYKQKVDENSYIALLDGEKIELNEYYVYLYLQKSRFESLGGEDIWEMDFDGQTGENLAKQFALDNVVYIKVSLREAERQKLALSEEEQNASLKRAEEYYYAALQDGKSVIGIEYWKKVNEDYDLYRKLYELITDSFIPAQEDFDFYFQQYYEDNRRNLTDVEAQVIRVGARSYSTARDIYQRAVTINEQTPISEKDFEALYTVELENSAGGSSEYSYTASASISEYAYPNEVVEAAYALSPGELSPLLEAGGGYYLLRIKSVTEPDIEALKKERLEVYTVLKKNEIFDQEFQKWSRSIEVVKNENVWDIVGIL